MLPLECAAAKANFVKTATFCKQHSADISLLFPSNQKATLLFSNNAVFKYCHLYSLPSRCCSVKTMAKNEATGSQTSTNSHSPSSGMPLFLA